MFYTDNLSLFFTKMYNILTVIHTERYDTTAIDMWTCASEWIVWMVGDETE